MREVKHTNQAISSANRQSSTLSPSVGIALDLLSNYSFAKLNIKDTNLNLKTLKELVALDLSQQPLCIAYLNLEATF